MSDDPDSIPVPDFDVIVPSSPQIVYETLGNGNCEKVCRSRGFQVTASDPITCTRNSVVYAARPSNGNYLRVLKVSSFKKRLASEFSNRKALPNSPYLVNTFSFFEDETHSVLELECCDSDIRNRLFTEQDLWILVHDIASALSIIHKRGFIHLDVSPGNILMNEGPIFKLADFGTLLRIGEFDIGCEGAGPYVSPESLEFPCGRYDVGPPSDIFSFGVVLLEAATGVAAPRGGVPDYRALRQGKIKLGHGAYECSLSSEFIDMVNMMLDTNPMKRPTAETISRCVWARMSVADREMDECRCDV